MKIEAKSAVLADYVTDTLSTKIVAQSHLVVVERGSTLKALEAEQTYQMSGNVSDETATSIGKQLGAEFVISGSITPRGDLFGMNIRVVQVETARIQIQWTVNNIRLDSSIVSASITTITAVAGFAGTELDAMDKDALIQDLQKALTQYNVPIEVFPADEASANTDYNFLITFRVNQRQPVNNLPALLAADLTIAFRKGTRVLKQSGRHSYTEMDMEFLVRKGGEEIVKDKAFFQSLPGIISQQ